MQMLENEFLLHIFVLLGSYCFSLSFLGLVGYRVDDFSLAILFYEGIIVSP